MKNTLTQLIFLLSFIPSLVFAQPGDPYLEHRLRWFNAVQDSVIKHPDNLFYRWARLQILFDPYFDVQTGPTEELKDFLWNSGQYNLYVSDSIVYHFQPCHMCRFQTAKKLNPATKLGGFLLNNQAQLIADLSTLIESDISFESHSIVGIGPYFHAANKASFLYKRGQLYYTTGKSEDGRQDFLHALASSPSDALKKRIYTSLAAYHFNKEESEQQENYLLALQYMRLAEPAVEDSSSSRGEAPSNYLYEREKLALMRKYRDSTAYVNYLQNRSISYLNYYYSLMETGDPKDRHHSESDKAFARSREYELMIYTYLIALNPQTGAEEFKKHKKLIIEKI